MSGGLGWLNDPLYEELGEPISDAVQHWTPTGAPDTLAKDRRQIRQAFSRRAEANSNHDVTVSVGSSMQAASRPMESARVRAAPPIPRPTATASCSSHRASSAASYNSAGTGFTVDGGGKGRRAGGESAFREKARPVHDTESLSAQVHPGTTLARPLCAHALSGPSLPLTQPTAAEGADA